MSDTKDNFNECIESVLNNASLLSEMHDLDGEDLLKIFSLITSSIMHEVGADSVATKFGELTLKEAS